MNLRPLVPGIMVQWWEPNPLPSANGEPNAKLFTGEHAGRDAKKHVMGLLTAGITKLQSFSVLEVFHVDGLAQRRVPDQWQPCLDLMLREQALGKGTQLVRRGPPKMHPKDFMAQVAEEYENGSQEKLDNAQREPRAGDATEADETGEPFGSGGQL